MPYEEKVVERYRHVVALEERGATEGERNAAATQRQRMDDKYPGIRLEAFPPPPPPPGAGFDPFSSWRTAHEPEPEPEPEDPRRGRGSFWDGIRWQDMAGDVLGWAARTAQEMSSLGTARAYAESTVEVQAKVLQSQKWQVSAKMNLRDLYAVAGAMNEAQRVEFARYVAAMVEAEVMAALTEASGG